MKANDPNSLRGPAAELIARLLPANSRAGAWLFGTQTRSLVDYGDVDLPGGTKRYNPAPTFPVAIYLPTLRAR